MIYIYVHKNKINGKCYVGQSKNYKKRWSGNGNRYSECPLFYNAIKKYGWNNFDSEIIDVAKDVDEANNLEEKYIEAYKSYTNGYNATSTGRQYIDGLKNYVIKNKVQLSKVKVKRPDNAARNKARGKPKVYVETKPMKRNSVHIYNLETMTDEYFESIYKAQKAIGASKTYIKKALDNGWKIYDKYEVDLV